MSCRRLWLSNILQVWILHHQVLECTWSIIYGWSLVGKSPLHKFLVMADVAQIIELLVRIAIAIWCILLILDAWAMKSRIWAWSTRSVDWAATCLMWLRLVLNQVGHVSRHVEEFVGKLVVLRHYLIHADVYVLGLLEGWVVRVLATVWSSSRSHRSSHTHAMSISLCELLSVLVKWLIGWVKSATYALMASVSSIASSSTSGMIASFHRIGCASWIYIADPVAGLRVLLLKSYSFWFWFGWWFLCFC